ncbi:MAG: Gx transporter family protein [Lachnospiraceae bacterium]|nr:Gx transporter family protein [Lachnospiraceae bacterium]
MSDTGNNDSHNALNVRSLAFAGVLLAAALILSYVESLVPFFFGVPGMKLGLPNLAVVLLLFTGRKKTALAVNILRIAVSGLLFGSLFSIIFSIAGAAASYAVMLFMMRNKKYGITGVSVAGGVSHNLAQLLIAAYVVKTSGIVYYSPVLIFAGTVTGMAIGAAASLMIRAFERMK